MIPLYFLLFHIHTHVQTNPLSLHTYSYVVQKPYTTGYPTNACSSTLNILSNKQVTMDQQAEAEVGQQGHQQAEAKSGH